MRLCAVLLMALSFQRTLLSLEYQDHAALAAQLTRLAATHGNLVHLDQLGRTKGGHEIWLVELGSGSLEERRRRPAMLVVAGIEGNDLVSTVSATAWIERLASNYEQNEATRRLADTSTIYVFPRVNPDAAEGFFARPKIETSVNNTPIDNDHDGLTDEDGPEDLNNDGLVSSMRVEDPEGEYISDPVDPRILIKADGAKGEKGAWKLFSEGVDNDKDEEWNEDPPGGVSLNRNFPFGYQFFLPGSGKHQVCEIETRALADFAVGHPNIAAVLTFGSADNVSQSPKSETGGKRPPAAISETDVPYYRELGRIYRDQIGLKKELTTISEPGSFSDWMYFHRGRFSLAVRPWTPQFEIERAKPPNEPASQKESGAAKDQHTAAGATQASGTKKTEQADPGKAEPKRDDPKSEKADKRGEEERAALKWFEANSPEAFIPWKEFKHPDFPGKKVEIGGWAPFARLNPPSKLLEEVASQHEKFLTEVAGRLPRIAFRKTEVKHLGNGVYNLVVQIENSGYLPTALSQGVLTREVLRTRVTLKLKDEQILSGERTTLLGPLAGSGGMREVRYTIHAAGAVEIEAVSALGGSVRRTVDLKEVP